MRGFDHVLCDLDGTLVDSAAGILSSLQACLSAAGIPARVELTASLIGPPLRALIERTTGLEDCARISALEAAFRDAYDGRGYRETHPYPGIADALEYLRSRGASLHVVTNKRRRPTESILEMLGWSGWFASVNCLEAEGEGSTKAAVVSRLLRLWGSAPSAGLIGDTADDALAASSNGVAFAWASWGYGSYTQLGESCVVLQDARGLMRWALRQND